MTKYDKVIPPGSEGKILAAVDIAHSKGPIEKGIDITSNDPENPEMRVLIRANVKTYVDIQPTEQVRLVGAKGETKTAQLTLSPAAGTSITLLNATVDSPNVEASLEKPSAGSSTYRLSVRLKEDAPVGTTQAKVIIDSEGMPEKQLVIPVVAVVRGPLAVHPQFVSFVLNAFPEEVETLYTAELKRQPGPGGKGEGPFPPGTRLRVIDQEGEWYQVITAEPDPKITPPGTNARAAIKRVGWIKTTNVKITKEAEKPETQTISIQNPKGKSFKILDYSATIPQIKVEMDPKSGEGKNYNLKISLVNANDRRAAQGSVIVKTDNPDQPEVKIPVVIRVS